MEELDNIKWRIEWQTQWNCYSGI